MKCDVPLQVRFLLEVDLLVHKGSTGVALRILN